MGVSTQSPSTVVDDATIGSAEWQNPSNATTQNDTYASVALGSGGNGSFSDYLKATNFGFSIPTSATIVGIKLEVDRYATNSILDSQIRVVKSGSISGTDKSTGASWSTSDTDSYISFGGPSDLWGLSWTPSDINSSDFGAAVACEQVGGFNTARIDHIKITVYYSSKIQGVQSIQGVSSITF